MHLLVVDNVHSCPLKGTAKVTSLLKLRFLHIFFHIYDGH